MIDINLHQAVEEDLKINRKKSILKSGTFLAFSLLIVVISTYVVVKFYQRKLMNSKNAIVKVKNEELKSFDSSKVDELVDFENRLRATSFNLQHKSNPETVFGDIEKVMIKGVSLNTLSYDATTNTLNMELIANSVKLVSSQVLNFKESGLFENILLADSKDGKGGNIKRDDANRAIFVINATLKKTKE